MDNLIQEYNQIQKDILHDYAVNWNSENGESTFRTGIKKFYGFEKEFSWNILLNAFYTIDDTEFAKESFKKFDLQGPSRHKDTGERYLRLYGILNALYQQKLAIQNLMEIHKLSDIKLYSKKLMNNEMLVLRNKIAAHSTNYFETKDDSEHKFDVYEISRPDLQSDKIVLLRNQKDFEEYDIKNGINDFDKLIETILSQIIGKLIRKVFKNQGDYYQRYKRLNILKDGNLIINDTIFRFK